MPQGYQSLAGAGDLPTSTTRREMEQLDGNPGILLAWNDILTKIAEVNEFIERNEAKSAKLSEDIEAFLNSHAENQRASEQLKEWKKKWEELLPKATVQVEKEKIQSESTNYRRYVEEILKPVDLNGPEALTEMFNHYIVVQSKTDPTVTTKVQIMDWAAQPRGS